MICLMFVFPNNNFWSFVIGKIRTLYAHQLISNFGLWYKFAYGQNLWYRLPLYLSNIPRACFPATDYFWLPAVVGVYRYNNRFVAFICYDSTKLANNNIFLGIIAVNGKPLLMALSLGLEPKSTGWKPVILTSGRRERCGGINRSRTYDIPGVSRLLSRWTMIP